MERTFTRTELLNAYAAWERDVRADRSVFKSQDEIAAMTPQQAAEESVAAIEMYVDATCDS
jgi:hypothetical protein